jgi:hypothetical protein
MKIAHRKYLDANLRLEDSEKKEVNSNGPVCFEMGYSSGQSRGLFEMDRRGDQRHPMSKRGGGVSGVSSG